MADHRSTHDQFCSVVRNTVRSKLGYLDQGWKSAATEMKDHEPDVQDFMRRKRVGMDHLKEAVSTVFQEFGR